MIGRSRPEMAAIKALPMPGQEKIVSITKEPPISPGSARPAMVTSGRSALRKTWPQRTARSVSPLARAVVT